MSKRSLRFFNDREVRAVWDDVSNCWWFSATDVVRAINDEPDYTKAGNYWRWLKRKFKIEGIQLVSGTHNLKIVAADGLSFKYLRATSYSCSVIFIMVVGFVTLPMMLLRGAGEAADAFIYDA